MPLLVVSLHPDETALLTFGEFEALASRRVVAFERSEHPLASRLAERAHVELGAPAPHAGDDAYAFVADPGSEVVVELARAGAVVTAGPGRAPDSLTAARGSYVARRSAAELATLALVMARLRSPEGCPWDREQDHRSLTVHLVEEAAEVLDAIDRGSVTSELEDELGDVLLQVFFHAQMAADDSRFDVAGVARAITSKLIHRHPHVFGDVVVRDAHEVVANWEAIKAAEKPPAGQDESLLAGVPASLSALLTTHKVQKRAVSRGFRADPAQARAKAAAALAELEAAPRADTDSADVLLGELLFWCVALARSRSLDPEGALRRAVRRFAAAPPPD